MLHVVSVGIPHILSLDGKRCSQVSCQRWLHFKPHKVSKYLWNAAGWKTLSSLSTWASQKKTHYFLWTTIFPGPCTPCWWKMSIDKEYTHKTSQELTNYVNQCPRWLNKSSAWELLCSQNIQRCSRLCQYFSLLFLFHFLMKKKSLNTLGLRSAHLPPKEYTFTYPCYNSSIRNNTGDFLLLFSYRGPKP